METRRRVGILLPAATLRRVVRHMPTWESADLYAAAAERLNLDTVAFALGGYSAHRQTVRGYVWEGKRWRAGRWPLPDAVLNRLVPTTLGSLHLVRLLAKQVGGRLFNQAVERDRWREWEELGKTDVASGRPPQMWPFTRERRLALPALMRQLGSVALIPRFGDADDAFVQIERDEGRDDRFLVTDARGVARSLGAKGLVRYARNKTGRRSYLIQQSIAAKIRCEIHAAAQRDGTGAWRITFADDPPAAVSRADLKRACIDIADRLAGLYSPLGDLGIDFISDAGGELQYVDTTLRDTRAAFTQEEKRVRLYRTQVAYAHHFIQRQLPASGG